MGGSGWRPPYPPEFRREAVRLVREGGRSRRLVARELGVSAESIRLWERRERLEREGEPALSGGERVELRRLRRENLRLREEQEVLRKAAVFFARETGGPR
jgi:transposase